MTLDEFMKSDFRNSYLDEPEWEVFYCRKSQRFVKSTHGEYVRVKSIDMGRIVARHPGKHAFRRLIERLRREYPEYSIFVECVQEQRFRDSLILMGFEDYGWDCFILTPEKTFCCGSVFSSGGSLSI